MTQTLTLSKFDQLKKKNLPGIFSQLTQDLIGERCTQVHFSYGDELCLDFGKLSPCDHPKLRDLLEGEWILCTRTTPWRIFADQQLILDSEIPKTDEEIEQAKQFAQEQIQGKTLVNLAINAEDLTTSLHFDDRYSLILYPDLDDEDLQHWVLFMPTEQVLTIGPGYTWSCKSFNDRY